MDDAYAMYRKGEPFVAKLNAHLVYNIEKACLTALHKSSKLAGCTPKIRPSQAVRHAADRLVNGLTSYTILHIRRTDAKGFCNTAPPMVCCGVYENVDFTNAEIIKLLFKGWDGSQLCFG